MDRAVLILLTLVALALPTPSAADEAPGASVPERGERSTPIDRGYGQADACWGDKYETDEDLKTGNEERVRQLLDRMLLPGS